MTTTSLNISLPEALKEFVHERVAEKAYSNPSDYIRALIREDQKRRAEEKLEQLLIEGLESGPPQPVTAEDWQAIRREVREGLAQRQRGSG
jgi:antitoxin ParD1/3/4